IEDGLGTNVDFFHLDCLSSEVRLNVDLDVTLTVIANGCYRWLASRLKGFDKAKPKQLYRKFVETGGVGRGAPGRPPPGGPRPPRGWPPPPAAATTRSCAKRPSTGTVPPSPGCEATASSSTTGDPRGVAPGLEKCQSISPRGNRRLSLRPDDCDLDARSIR